MLWTLVSIVVWHSNRLKFVPYNVYPGHTVNAYMNLVAALFRVIAVCGGTDCFNHFRHKTMI